MTEIEAYQVYRLQKSAKRLREEYEANAPAIIKKIELVLIKEICDDLRLCLE